MMLQDIFLTCQTDFRIRQTSLSSAGEHKQKQKERHLAVRRELVVSLF